MEKTVKNRSERGIKDKKKNYFWIDNVIHFIYVVHRFSDVS